MMKKLAVGLAAAAAVGGFGVSQADAYHLAGPPAEYDSIEFIQNAYPGLYANELYKPERNWNRLRRAAKTVWMHDHPCLNGALQWRYKLLSGANQTPAVFKIIKGASWKVVEYTWECGNVPERTRAFLGCIVDHEGGRTYPDVWFTEQSIRSNGGNLRGYRDGYAENANGIRVKVEGTNRVVNHFQTRPYHARRAHPELATGDRDRTVNATTFRILTNPVSAARIAVDIFHDRPGAYATFDNCQQILGRA